MQMLARLALSVSVFSLLITAACLARPAWMARMNLDVWELPHLLSRAEQERQREAELNDLSATLRDRMQRKSDIQTGLIAGRLSLAEAASRYRRLVGSEENFWDFVCQTYPAPSKTEVLCRYLIDCAVREVQDQSERRQVQARLCVELAEMRCGPGAGASCEPVQ